MSLAGDKAVVKPWQPLTGGYDENIMFNVLRVTSKIADDSSLQLTSLRAPQVHKSKFQIDKLKKKKKLMSTRAHSSLAAN